MGSGRKLHKNKCNKVPLLSQIVNWKDQLGSVFTLVFLTQGAARPAHACSIRLKLCLENKRT